MSDNVSRFQSLFDSDAEYAFISHPAMAVLLLRITIKKVCLTSPCT